MTLNLPSAREIDELLAGLSLPGEALLGAASSGFQVEGGYNTPGRPHNNWHEWEHLPGNEPCGAATRFWEAPWRDLDLAQGLGFSAHRLSVEWARVQPSESTVELEQEPEWDAAAVARYVEILIGCRQRGLEPVVTLHHFSHPAWVGPDLWLSDERVGRWLVFVARIVPELNAGLLPGATGTQVLARLLGPALALQCLLTARVFRPEELPPLGLAQACVDDALAHALQLAARLQAVPARACAHIKRLVRDAAHRPAAESLAAERTLFCDCMVDPEAEPLMRAIAEGRRTLADAPELQPGAGS